MGLTMRERQAVGRQLRQRYLKAGKKERGRILDEFVGLTGYNRSYARYVLRHGAVKTSSGVKVKTTRRRSGKYDGAVMGALRGVWIIADYICGKRLAPLLKEIVPVLERFGELTLTEETRGRLMEISPATIDRLLVADRRRMEIKGRSRTKPGTLLKHQIPVRTFADWDDLRPGFAEIDLVGHDGGDAVGEYAQTLDVVDVCTGWTETEAVRNKAQKWVFEALKDIEKRMPFPLLGIDSDNGSEFINGHLLRYCKENEITFTRARPYRKNDNCHVEQKNYSVVRRAVGYARYDTPEELRTLNELYGHLRLYTNFFQPVMKLREKTRTGSRVTKRYDTARTPMKRALESEHLDATVKRILVKQHEGLNPAELKRRITRLQEKLFALSTSGKTPSKQMKKLTDLEYISK